MTSYIATEKWKSHKTCLTNHARSISHHIMLLVINGLGGRQTPGTDPEINQGGWLAWFFIYVTSYCEHYHSSKFKDMKWRFSRVLA